MGWLIMGSVGAVFAGLFLGFRDLLPFLAARRDGVITRKGARGLKVRRDEDPDGFARLLANRGKGAGLGFSVSIAGMVVLALFGLALSGTAGPFALLVSAVYLGLAVIAGWCLYRGFATGRMFGFWSMALYGDATLKQNPMWFWIYASANVALVLNGAVWLFRAMLG